MSQNAYEIIKPLTLTIQGGVDKDGRPDAVSEIEISRGR